MPHDYGNSCQAGRCTAMVDSEWNPDPPPGSEKEFCGTFGIYSKWKDDGGRGTRIFDDGLHAIKCSDNSTKGFTARNLCVKELKGACKIQNVKQPITAKPTTTAAPTETSEPPATIPTTTQNMTVGEKCGDGWTPHSVGATQVHKEDLINNVNLEEITCLKDLGVSTIDDDPCSKIGARRLYFTTTHGSTMISNKFSRGVLPGNLTVVTNKE